MDDAIIEINLLQIFKAIWQRILAVIIAAVIGAGAMFSLAAFVIPPKYEAEAMMYVNNSSFSVGSTSFSISNAELTAAQSLVDTYIVILNSWPVLDQVMEKAGVRYEYDELRKMLSADPVNSTEVFSVKVKSKDPQEAERIANAVVAVLPDRIADIVDGSSMRIVASALLPTEKVSPSITMFTAIGLLAGIAIACLVIVIQTINDTQIHDEDYLIETYNLPILAVIPDLFGGSKDAYYSYSAKKES